VYGNLIFAAGLAAVMIGSGFMRYFGSGRARAGDMMLRVMLGTDCFLAFLFAGVGLLPLALPPGTLIVAAPLFGLAIIGVLVVTASRPPDEEQPPHGRPSPFVPKTIGWGYTFNFANRYAWKNPGHVIRRHRPASGVHGLDSQVIQHQIHDHARHAHV
jgi:hypothetical protein